MSKSSLHLLRFCLSYFCEIVGVLSSFHISRFQGLTDHTLLKILPIVSMNSSSPERKGVASDEDAETQLCLQYAGLHSNERYPDDQSFLRLLQESSASRVKEYLDELTEAYSRAEDQPTAFRNEIWHAFLLRKPRAWSTMRSIYKLEEDVDLDKEFIELAFFHQYPRWSQQGNVSYREMLDALLEGSVAAGEELLAAIEPESKHTQILKAGYRHPYLRHETILKPILKRLSEATQKWTRGEYLAPYTTLLGPNLVGKTRLLQQLSKNICVIYICLCPHNSTGLPSRSPLADELVPAAKNFYELELVYTRFLAAVFHVVAEFFSKQPAQISEEKRLKKWFKFNSEYEDEFASRVRQRMREVSNAKLDDHATLGTSLKKMHESACFIQNPHLKVLLAIDEARELAKLETRDFLRKSYFLILRQVLSTIPGSLGFFAIFTDIPLAAAEPNRTIFYDPTGRPDPGSIPKELFPPIYDIGTFDSKVPPGRPKTWAELLSPRRLFSYGLPFFRIYVEGAEEKGMADHMIVRNIGQITTQKLLGFTKAHEPLSEGQVFALMGSTIQPRTNSATKLNSELISNHLAMCLYISPSRDRVISEYPSQFACSMAANHFLATDESRLIDCIDALTSALQPGVISSGNAEELASRIILLRAMHKAMSISEDQIDIPYGCSVRLVDFLCALTGSEEQELELGDIESQHKKRLLTEARIFWNHFIKITYTPHASDLLEFMYRGVAVQCMPMQPGFDQLFTIYFDSGDPNSVLTKDHISFCGVRVKNEEFSFEREASEWTDEYAEIKINPENPYLSILFSFKTQSTQQHSLPKILNRGSLIFHGLTDIKCLTAGISEAPDKLLAVEDDVRGFHKENQMKNFLETASPVVYPRH
ncbi:hypothetical protein PGT21_014036 [Puccinia graminis f. sp. tritici]|uniref:Uncharacterized protein n=2 Tax=Puccinia graminis f. sp. tritici TaxID=56615 RepID=A0A5B0MCN8_PUCGR|nr:hypothetical protein PGT21_014036 [Puccinia graminis f. sp. tritici]